jgi:outer membrane protein assembly factor BamA
LSLIAANISYSTNHLLNFNIKTDIFVLNERLILNGDWRILKSSETTYGLGTATPNSSNDIINGYETSADSLGQALRYNQIRIHETGSWKFFPNFFAGLGIQYDHYYGIKDQKLENNDTASSYHYQYSKAHKFNPQQYTSSGFGVNFLYDSRDNQVNAYKGYYANVNYLINLTGMGSSSNSSILLTEFRSFHSLDKKSRNVIAVWLYGKYVVSGEAPYLQLPALGYDQRQRTGRGYTYGRFRGESMMYGELEYRFPISMRTGILGGVAFINTTSTTDKKNQVELLEYFKLGYGGGLRFMMDKTSRTRLAIDVGIANRVVGFYLAAQEAF